MKIDVKVPAVGESVTEATIGSWNKKNGEFVKRNEVLLLLETDKASVEVVAENDGVLAIQVEAGQVVKIGATVGILDTEGKASAVSSEAPKTAPVTASQPTQAPVTSSPASAHLSPAVQRIVTENNLNPSQIAGTGKDGRLTKGDVLAASTAAVAPTPAAAPAKTEAKSKAAPAPAIFAASGKLSKQGEKKIVPMTTIRKKIAERLVEAQNTAAILTTFNEIDMTKVNEIRNKYKDKFKEKYGISLGMMGIFTKAAP